MNGFIFISVLLHVVSLYFIVVLWKKNEKINTIDQEFSLETLEELMELFSQEMREENERLQQLMIQLYDENKRMQTNSTNQSFTSEADLPIDESISLEDKEVYPEQKTNEVLLLAKKGYDATEIAKMLNRGKGEIELLLKFYG
ncbi:hypothetical protein KUV80_05360 [Fictibacillus nanhaiensis]|uniref:DUF6115 domain-containing protein n=1 Tax=Fictibacillus nanhaiensis TaxID=742169 RepID=UPI001C976E9A|nr:hypothetical protein [Fictibacillus nanhaiensis]MBY6036066.1 hypothetical protein [Fictibacillus nanhaiensis]